MQDCSCEFPFQLNVVRDVYPIDRVNAVSSDQW